MVSLNQNGRPGGPRAGRQFDIVVLGATGFVGRLVCEEIACNYQDKVDWAMAGPHSNGLEYVRDQLRQFNSACKSVPIIKCNVEDSGALDDMTSQTRCVINLAGPYALHGTPVVESCIRNKTNYVDLTGENIWLKRIIDQYHSEAERQGVKIICSCGVEAAAPDISVLLLAEYMRKAHNRRLASATTVVQVAEGMRQAFMSLDGGFSGGTWSSLMNMFKKEAWSDIVALQSPTYLCEGKTEYSDSYDSFVPGYVKELKTWTAPSLLGVADRRTVHRSALLLEYDPAGFKYNEHIQVPNIFTAIILSFFTMLLGLMLMVPIFHPLVRALGNKPRHGPSVQTQLRGCWKMLTVGKSHEDDGVAPKTAFAIVGDAGRDPGYWSTARIVLEAGLVMALEENTLSDMAGVITPAALGMPYVERLRQAGYTALVREHHGIDAYC